MTPGFYDPTKVGDVWIERAGLVAEEAAKLPALPASSDKTRIAAFGIDCQIGFATPGASLFVPGAVEDTRRTIEWLYRNLGQITEITMSLDTHRVFQIFHPSFWIDDSGNHPAPFTVITVDDVAKGKWRGTSHEAECRAYVERLAAQGNYVLTIWPYHALLGGVSHAIVPALMEAITFHALVRHTPTVFEQKGEAELTESYSVLSPEVKEKDSDFNQALVDRLMTFDRVYVFGQAKSHCVLSTLEDLAQKGDPNKVWILEDAMSPVPPPPLHPLPPELDFPKVAARAFEALAARGMHIVKTTDPL